MTRYQVWKIRERARFRAEAEFARCRRLRVPLRLVSKQERVINAVLAEHLAKMEAWKRGISEPFLG